MRDQAAEPVWLADLETPAAYPLDSGTAAAIRRIDTHISHVFLTAGRAYKLRRPVRLSFLDFSDPAERLADCLREVALNRRLAPDVYLGIAPVLEAKGGEQRVEMGPVADTPSGDPRAIEHAVVMRRLAEGRDLKSMLERGEVTTAHLDRVAAHLARFHKAHSLGRPAPFGADEWLAVTTGPARANVDALATCPPDLAPPADLEEARRLAAAFLDARRDDFDRRRRDGRIVDGHGDLHSEHVWFESDASQPLMVDCLEFRDDFRRIDAASDVSFLAMDLAYRGRADFAALFLRRYARAGGDYHLFSVVDYFLSYRALVRAKVASLVATDATLAEAQRGHARESVRRHLELGLGYLRNLGERGPGRLVLTCGTIGTGKSTVAEALADACGGVVISSDRVRRDDASAAAGAAPAAYGHKRYSEAARAAVYERLLEEARHVVVSGRVAILDATFSRRAWRDLAAEHARRLGSEAALVEVAAPKDEVIERLTARAAAGHDASEAGPGLYDAMQAEFEAPDEWPLERRARIDTASADWTADVVAAARRLGIQ
ncbi:MAG: AAA family ATPase [Candidatus Binatia bacterium]